MPLLFTILLSFIIYHAWFFPGVLSSGDWPYLFKENIQEFSFFSKDWVLWLTPYYQSTAKIFVQTLGLSWQLGERFFWFWPLFFLLILGSYYLTKSALGALIYATNTYILMVAGGGQLGVALGYAFAPLVIAKWIRNESLSMKSASIAGLLFALQMMFDPRIAYITLMAVFIYYVLFSKNFTFKSIGKSALPLVIGILLNSWWIIGLQKNAAVLSGYQGFESTSGFRFFSFSDFAHALSLLHPNWPENIFGKVYFLQPEFLIIPIVAFSSLFFAHKAKNRKDILFFALLGILGAFFAKGANEPFGAVNLFLFEKFPGMSMFRDPTKFYTLTALSYSMLIPFSLSSIQDAFDGKMKNLKLPSLIKTSSISVLFIIFYLFLIRQAILGQLSGTFKPHEVPREYIELKEFLKNNMTPSPTFWVPTTQRFGFYSKIHPEISGQDYFHTTSSEDLVSKLKSKEGYGDLKKLHVLYIIVPYDSEKELFIRDRKYDDAIRSDIIKKLETIPWLQRDNAFHDISVFKVSK